MISPESVTASTARPRDCSSFTRTLKDAGHTTACFVGATFALNTPGSSYGPTSRARLAGFLHGWGGTAAEVPCLYADFYSINCGAAAVARYMELTPRPNAVFAASDELAMGFIAGALAHDLRAGRDYSIVGFDGQDMARALALTTVEVPVALLGQRAARLLVERLNHPELPPQRVFLGCSMLPGNTVMRAEP